MLEKILTLKNKQNSLNEFCENIRQGIPSAVFGVCDSFKNFLISILDEKVLYIVKDAMTARLAIDEINELSGKKAIYLPPKDEILLMNKAFSKDNVYARIRALLQIQSSDVIITTAEALMQTAPTKLYDITLTKDQDISQSDLISNLVMMGYDRVDTVISQGTFSVRGDIIDVFPINQENPIRIDFFGDSVEAIKNYNAESRQNLGYVDKVSIIQAVEFVFNNDNFNDFKQILREELENSNKEQKRRRREIFDDLLVAMEIGIWMPLTCLTFYQKIVARYLILCQKMQLLFLKKVKEFTKLLT